MPNIKTAVTFYGNDPEFQEYAEDTALQVLDGLFQGLNEIPSIERRILVIHDRDPDGYCANALLQRYLSRLPQLKVQIEPIAHGRAFVQYALPEVAFYDLIVVLDHEVPLAIYQRLKAHCAHLVVFDHHPGSAETRQTQPFIFYDKRWSTVALVDGFLHSVMKTPWHTVAGLVDHYDSWRFGTSAEIDEMVHSFMSQTFLEGAKNLPWKLFLDADGHELATQSIHDFIHEGQVLRKIQDKQIEVIAKKYTYYGACMFEGEPRMFALCLHSDFYDRLGNYLINSNPALDFVVIAKVSISPTPLKLHFRSRDDRMDVRDLSRFLGGGGHRNSSGVELQFKDLPALLGALNVSI